MKIDLSGEKPIYLQIIDYFKTAVLSGRYRDGDRIPPVRELALLLKINPNTVAKAYRLMQDEGLLLSRPGGGNFIAVPEDSDLTAEREGVIRGEIRKLQREAAELGITPARLLELFHLEGGEQ